MKRLLALAMASALGGAANAQLFVYDDFSTTTSGMGFDAGDTWDSPLVYSSASPLGTGTGQYSRISEFGESFRRIDAAAKAAIDARTSSSQTFWVGFLARWNGPNGSGQGSYGGVQARQGATGTGGKRFFMGTLWETGFWGAGTAGDTVDVPSSVGVVDGQVRHLAFEFNLSTRLADMYVDGVKVLDTLHTDSGSTFFTSLDVLKIEAGSAANQIIDVDELRVGATQADVNPVPEPATMAVLAGGLALLAKRRRR
ncbi:MAG: PEP-CTERM sorting domain-containing protein [Fimbriimonadaceae bacterium]|nr:PEP-CTERM sorting domain-containing protein [Fimbriimonadaceae bacterium]